MFTNLCLILLLLLAGSLQFRNFTFNYRKKAKKKSRKRSNIVQLADGVTALAQFYALYSHRAHSFDQWQRVISELYYNSTYNELTSLFTSPSEHGSKVSNVQKQRTGRRSQSKVVRFSSHCNRQASGFTLLANDKS